MVPAATPLTRISTPVLKSRRPMETARAPAPARECRRAACSCVRSTTGTPAASAAGSRPRTVRQVGGQPITERGRRQADQDEAAAEPVHEGDAALARDLRQQPETLDPQGHRDEMRREHMWRRLVCGVRSIGSTDTTIGNSRIALRSPRRPPAARCDAGAERRNQDDLRRPRPDQQPCLPAYPAQLKCVSWASAPIPR